VTGGNGMVEGAAFRVTAGPIPAGQAGTPSGAVYHWMIAGI
jgi:hypothetical protein